jgi:ketosteroid isomerase-like protein
MTPGAVARKLFELAAEGDTESILELLDPEVVWLGTRGGLDANRVSRGPDAFVAYMQEIEQTWEDFEVEVQRVIEADETVVVFLRETARGRGALDVESETAVVLKVRGGRIVEARGYLDHDEALEVAGLRP